MKLMLGLIIGIIFITNAYADDSKFIPWSENRKLVWDDFNGIAHEYPKEYKRPNPLDIAFTWGESRLIDFNYVRVNSPICQYQITSVNAVGFFDKSQSWTTEQARSSSTALSHEQGHFDIIEIHSRKIESTLLFKVANCPDWIYDKSLINNTIRASAEEIGRETQKVHDRYDADIKRNSSLQQKWNSQIKSDLMKYQTQNRSFKMKIGIDHEEISCIYGWKVVQKHSNNNLACVTPASSLLLEKRDWGKIVDLSWLN